MLQPPSPAASLAIPAPGTALGAFVGDLKNGETPKPANRPPALHFGKSDRPRENSNSLEDSRLFIRGYRAPSRRFAVEHLNYLK